MLKNLSAIDTNRDEGRYLMAVLAKITTTTARDKTPDEVLKEIGELADKMYENAPPVPEPTDESKLLKEAVNLLAYTGRFTNCSPGDIISLLNHRIEQAEAETSEQTKD